MLRVAVPNKGILSDAAVSMFKEAGYKPSHVAQVKDLSTLSPLDRRGKQ